MVVQNGTRKTSFFYIDECGDIFAARKISVLALMTISADTSFQDRVAIIVPAYNAEKTLGATLESALCQGGAIEIVVVDDGSSDATLSIARSFEPRLRVLTGPNNGVSAARNRGVAETRAGWLLFLDADDQLVAGSIAERLSAPDAVSADVIICDWEEIIDDGHGKLTDGPQRSIDWDAIGQDAELAIAVKVWATTAAILYRRALVERIGGFRHDLPVIQDARLLFDAAYHGGRIVHSAHVGARYRQLPGSLSRRNPVRFWQDVLLNGQQIEAAWRRRGPLDDDHRKGLNDIYACAARFLFKSAHPDFFAAVAAARKLGQPETRLMKVATPIARLFGVRAACSVLSRFYKA